LYNGYGGVMAEKLTSISEARRNLPTLSQAAQSQFDRFIITHQGQPQSVLVGISEYQSLKASVELLQRPDIIDNIVVGLAEMKTGNRILLKEMNDDFAVSSKTLREAKA
jgi:prevent-host-death family protein